MIAFREFSKRFGRVDAASSLTFEVNAGEVVALLGPNGSGKTTTIKAAAGLIRPTSGEVLIGVPGRPAIDPAARQVASFLPQRVAFPEALTGREVIDFYASLRHESFESARDVMQFTGLNGASARPVGTYSGGMRQRLGLAVALLARSPVLLLDEPTAALDPDGLCAFYGLIERHRGEDRAVLFSSHQMGDVERLADRFVVLIDGRLVASFTARELTLRLADRGVMKITFDRQPRALPLDTVRHLAPGAVWTGELLVIPAPAAARLAVFDVVRASGATIRSLSSEDGRLDTFYRELVGGRH